MHTLGLLAELERTTCRGFESDKQERIVGNWRYT